MTASSNRYDDPQSRTAAEEQHGANLTPPDASAGFVVVTQGDPNNIEILDESEVDAAVEDLLTNGNNEPGAAEPYHYDEAAEKVLGVALDNAFLREDEDDVDLMVKSKGWSNSAIERMRNRRKRANSGE